MASDLRIHLSFLGKLAEDDSQILSRGGVSLELFREASMGDIIFGRHQNAAGILVQAVDDPWPKNPSDSSQVATVVEEGVDQGAGVVPRPRVNNHSRRFIDDQQVAILIKDTKREGLRPDF